MHTYTTSSSGDVESGDLNSGSQACTVSVLPTELLPQLHDYIRQHEVGDVTQRFII